MPALVHPTSLPPPSHPRLTVSARVSQVLSLDRAPPGQATRTSACRRRCRACPIWARSSASRPPVNRVRRHCSAAAQRWRSVCCARVVVARAWVHLVVRPCPKSRLRDGGEWGRKGRLKAGSGLCELGSSSRWPPWRRCFCVWQDGGDALLLALKFIGAVEAGALMESIIVRAAASRRHLLQRLRSRSWWTSRARSSPGLGQ
jgi:hypothetical protein